MKISKSIDVEIGKRQVAIGIVAATLMVLIVGVNLATRSK